LGVEPNAIQDVAKPMTIRVAGIPRGESAHLQVLQDCDGDNRPDLTGTTACKNPLYEWDSPPADAEGVEDRVDFQALRAAGRELPANQSLWLRASRKGSSQALYALFGLVKDPCSLLQSFLASFGRGPCHLGLPQALLQHRGASAWKSSRYEVRRVDLGTEPYRPVSVLGTQGATGLAWLDAQHLLVTIASTAGSSRLLRVPLSGGNPEILWVSSCDDDRLAIAPLALPGGRIAFVRQSASSILLSVLENGIVDPKRDLELPGGIHQLVASDPEGKEILALTLGVEESRPAFLRIDLEARHVENLGFHPAFYQAAFSSPKGDRAIVALEDNAGRTGWDLALVDATGKLVGDVQARPESDLLPAWQPGGGEVAFLAEVERSEVKP
jgi:hypothetical protein